MKQLEVGQLITVGFEVEFWGNPDDTRLDYRSDRWAPFKILGIDANPDYDYVTLDLECADGIWMGEVQLDLDPDDIEIL